MNAKGWKLKKTDGTTLYFEKNNGTYANLKVSDIKFYFYEDKFYDAFISFPVKTKTDDIIDALIAIQESCNLTSVSEDKKKYEGYDILLYKFADPQLNTFSLMIMGRSSIFILSFELTNFEINSEKNAAEEKRKEEEKAKKNKSISSDL